MTEAEAKLVIDGITLVGGQIRVVPFNAKTLEFQYRISISVTSRGGDPKAPPILVSMTQDIPFDLLDGMDGPDLIAYLQKQWTSLWMHESLETFIYKGTLPFDPHCKESLRPKIGTFLTDDRCEIVEVFA